MKQQILRLLALTILVNGCNALLEPAHQLQLDGSSWSVAAIDGVALLPSSAPTVTFDSPARIETGCRTMLLSWDMDTDGASLAFETPTATATPCDPALAKQDQMLALALAGVDRWSVDNTDAIVLRGDHAVVLKRVGTSGP